MNLVEKGKFELQRLMLHSAYKETFSGKDGEKVLKHLADTFCNGQCWDGGNARLSDHLAGRRFVILTILKFLNRDPSDLISNPQENNEY